MMPEKLKINNWVDIVKLYKNRTHLRELDENELKQLRNNINRFVITQPKKGGDAYNILMQYINVLIKQKDEGIPDY